MTVAPGLQHFGIKSDSAVSHQDPQFIRGVFHLDFDGLRAGMPEGVCQSLPSNPVNLIPNERMKWARCTFHDDMELRFVVPNEFLLNLGKSRPQIQ